MDIEHVGQPDNLNKPTAPPSHPWPAVAKACDQTPGDWYRVLRDYPTSAPAQNINNGRNRHLPPDRYQARTRNSGRTPTGRPLYDVYVRAYPTPVSSNRDRGSHPKPVQP